MSIRGPEKKGTKYIFVFSLRCFVCPPEYSALLFRICVQTGTSEAFARTRSRSFSGLLWKVCRLHARAALLLLKMSEEKHTKKVMRFVTLCPRNVVSPLVRGGGVMLSESRCVHVGLFRLVFGLFIFRVSFLVGMRVSSL